MKFADIESELAPFEALIETIPHYQIQGIKISRILLSKIDELFQEIAVKDERIEYLSSELFGKNKNKEDPEAQEGADGDQDEVPKKSEKDAKKKLEIRRVKKGKSKRYYLWCLHTELAVVFELTEKRNQALAKEFIGEGGTVMTDGLGIYSEKVSMDFTATVWPMGSVANL